MPDPLPPPEPMACLAEARRLIARGVADRRSALHTPTLGSVTMAGTPSLRTVVLRDFDADAFTLRLHTDRRSPKARELAANPAAALHFYDPGQRVQLRLGGEIALHAGDALADAAWRASRQQSRFCYTTACAPGTEIAAPPPAPVSDEGGFERFMVLVFAATTLDFLHLAASGHVRAGFCRDDTGWRGHWLAP